MRAVWQVALFGLLCFSGGVAVGMLAARVYWTHKWAKEVERWAAEVRKWARLTEEWAEKVERYPLPHPQILKEGEG